MGAKLGVLEKAGAYYSYNNTRLGQGRENVKTYLKTNKEVANEIYNGSSVRGSWRLVRLLNRLQ